MRYYSNLYKQDEVAEANLIARERCLQSVPTIVTRAQNQQLTREITLEEIKEAIDQLSTHKASGEDCLPIEFYQEFVDLTGPALMELAK